MDFKKSNIVFVIILLVSVAAMMLYSTNTGAFNIDSNNNKPINFSVSETQYSSEKKSLTLSIDNELGYIDENFWVKYIEAILEPSTLKVKITDNDVNSEPDGKLVIMDDDLRDMTDKYKFTSPLLKTTNSLFIRDDFISDDKPLSGVYVKGTFTHDEIQTFSYDNQSIEFIKADSSKDAVELAIENELDCIAGNQDAISSCLRDSEIDSAYVNQFTDSAQQNICISLPVDEDMLYGIINKCIKHADMTTLAKQASDGSLAASDILIQENRFEDSMILIIIIFAAVFAAFFFYYSSNKTLYDELKERMDQLTASKQELQTTFNGVSYYLAELEPDGKVIDINTAFLNHIETDPIGKYIWDVMMMPEDAKSNIISMMDETKALGSGSSGEMRLKKHIIEINIFPIKSKKGEINKLLFMASDVTGERMAERQMLQDNKMIAVGQLAAGIAHEIRNPLGIIRNYCYILKNMKDENTHQQAIQVIEKSVDTAGNIIDTLLNFSKASDLRIDELYIKKHIDDVLLLNKGLLKKKQAAVSVSCDEDFKVLLAVESFDMIFINLITNAIDAINDLGRIDIGIAKGAEDFTVTVSDNGCGIESDILEEIFNPFFTTKSTVEGNGLGLYIVYNEIQKLNGTIDVTSEIDHGTTFTVTLPLRMEDEPID